MNMAASKDLLFVVLLAVLPQSLPPSVGNFLAPLLSPFPEDLCKGMECGKGSCKVSGNITHPYECECEAGWKQFPDLKFLPCVFPNCSLDNSCTKGQPSIQEKSHAANESLFNPCHWADCGGGSCNRTSPFSYNCLCDEGYYNLLNVSVFPCFKQCAIGFDCSRLGIPSSNKSAVSPNVADNGANDASSLVQGCPPWQIILMLLLGMLQWI